MSWIMSHSVCPLMCLKSERKHVAVLKRQTRESKAVTLQTKRLRCFGELRPPTGRHPYKTMTFTSWTAHCFFSCSDLLRRCLSDRSLGIVFCNCFSTVLRGVVTIRHVCSGSLGYTLSSEHIYWLHRYLGIDLQTLLPCGFLMLNLLKIEDLFL